MEEEQDLSVLNEMSGDHSGSDRGTNTADNLTFLLPAYLAYLSLGFKVISTVIIVLMAGWVIITIRTTRSLHKIHNIYVAYVMFIDAMYAFIFTLFSGAMMIGYFTGVGDFISCNVVIFMLYLTGISYLTFLLMSVDKVMAVTFLFKHRELMKPRVVCGILVTKHILIVMVYVKYLFAPSGTFTKTAQFSMCTIEDQRVEDFIVLIIPMFLASVITISLDVYLTIKAYQVRKQIEEENKLSGGHTEDNAQLKALKKKNADIKKHIKPVITLMVVVMGNSFIGLIFSILLVSALYIDSPMVYKTVVIYLITPNISHVNLLLHPFAYALYFKQVREPMMRLLKRITRLCKCKSAAVAPEIPRTRINWLNPN